MRRTKTISTVRTVEKEVKEGCILGKLVYVFEGSEAVRKGRNALINLVYFGGRYAGLEERMAGSGISGTGSRSIS